MSIIAKDVKPLTEEQKKLVEDNLKLANWFFKRTPRGIYMNDKQGFKQELLLALVKSASTYDKEKGSFATHVTWQMRAAVSLWMHNKKKTAMTKYIEDCFPLEEEDATSIIIDPKTIHKPIINIDKFREILFALPLKDRMCLQQAKFIFSDYDESLKFKGTNVKNVRINMETEVALNIIKSYHNLAT